MTPPERRGIYDFILWFLPEFLCIGLLKTFMIWPFIISLSIELYFPCYKFTPSSMYILHIDKSFMIVVRSKSWRHCKYTENQVQPINCPLKGLEYSEDLPLSFEYFFKINSKHRVDEEIRLEEQYIPTGLSDLAIIRCGPSGGWKTFSLQVDSGNSWSLLVLVVEGDPISERVLTFKGITNISI